MTIISVLTSTRALVFVAFFLSLKLDFVHGQSSSSTTGTGTQIDTSSALRRSTSTTGATIFPGNEEWEYIGCWNETTLVNGTGGARALPGSLESRETMQVPLCWDICSKAGYSIAGLEYTTECYCDNHLNALSSRLDESKCNLGCRGNHSSICGGALTLSVYEKKKEDTRGAGSNIAREAPVGSILALGIAMGTLLCLA